MQKTIAQRWIDHHLEAASCYAEEAEDKTVQEIIDRARKQIDDLSFSERTSERPQNSPTPP